MFVIYLIFGVLLGGINGNTFFASATPTCGKDYIHCLESNGTCIPQNTWCDGEIDCPEGSDEQYCDHGNECLDPLFTCDNGMCVPYEVVCNGFDNCGDYSDETCGGNRDTTDKSQSVLPVVQAAHYLLSARKADYGWDEFTPRALIALAFAEKYLPIPEKERNLMTKRLDLQIFFLLRDGVKNLATLALHINALYAMCKDPRDFHGIDLVEILRSKTDEAMKSDFNLPIVLLTLCIAKDTRPADFEALNTIYNGRRNYRVGVKALTVMAMSACIRQQRPSHRTFDMESKIYDFISQYRNAENIDLYSKALMYQAYNVAGRDTSQIRKQLLQQQAEDGSFGDLLGTYSAIPALLNMSLADLQCKTRTYKEKSTRLGAYSSEQIFKPEKEVDYSLWITSGENAGYHTVRVKFEGEKSFFDVMKMAEFRNPMYRFKYDESFSLGKKVYYLAGIPNDAEKGMTWMLYKTVSRSVAGNATKDKRKEMDGVDRIMPKDGDHFTFQLERLIDYRGQ